MSSTDRSGRRRRPGRSRTGVAAGVALLLIAVAVPLSTPLPALAVAPRPMSGAGIVLNANPSTGTAPLLVDFSLSTPNGTVAPQYEWAFGDGEYLNGSGRSYDAPSHTYLAPGTYEAVATAIWPAGPENASVTIVVVSSVLAIHLEASPVNGTVPLTVTFNATPVGGSGTYLSYLWTFGDGGAGSGLDVRYTYVMAGTFEAVLTVTDSRGTAATAGANVTVRAAAGDNNSSSRNGTPDGARSGGTPGLATYLPDIAVAVLIVGVAVFLSSGAWVLNRRRGARAAPASASPAAPAETAVGPPPAAAVVPVVALAPPTPGDAPSRASLPVLPPLPPEPSGLAASRRLALQLLRTMGTLPRVGPGELAGPEWTQAGLARTAGAGQSAISRVLRRLTAAGIVVSETTHVAGGDRRLRVYRLTPRGERLARALVESGGTDVPDPLSGSDLPG